MNVPVIEALDLVKFLGHGAGRVEALRGVSLSLAGGQLTLLMGPSGSGKTTLLSVLGCILTASEGTVRLRGRCTTGMAKGELAKLRRDHIGFVFQSYHLFSTLTAIDNVRLALDVRGERSARAIAKAKEVLLTVGLSHKENSFPHELSGGEQQRVAIARAIVGDASVILADEPTGALDGENGYEIMTILSNIAKDPSRGVLVVTHDPRIVPFADRIIHIEDGRIVNDGPVIQSYPQTMAVPGWAEMSWRNQALTWALRRWIKPNSLRDQTIAEMRKRTGVVPFAAKLAPGWQIRKVQFGALKGEWIEPAAPDHTARTRCILYFHGGGYVAMSARTHRSITSRLATWSDASLFALDYRLAPEFPFPAALDDALDAWHVLIAMGARPSHMLLAGDSAGGGLALALLLALREANESLPAAAVLFSPWTDLAATGESIVVNSAIDPLISGSWVAPMARHYLAGTPATNPLVSPVYADLTGLPALFIQASDSEVLLDDSRRLVENACKAGVETMFRIWPGVPHGWQIFAAFLPEAQDALREASDFIASRLGQPG